MKGKGRFVLKYTWVIILLPSILYLFATPHLSSIHPSPFTLHQENDSLYWLNEWRLPYPVYRFCTGDVDGDGSIDAMVGVVKKTRFHREIGRRIFIFKQVDGKVRPLWLGSRLGATLVDFRFVNGCVRALETDGKGKYGVTDYCWNDFGMTFERFIIKNTDQETALKYFDL